MNNTDRGPWSDKEELGIPKQPKVFLMDLKAFERKDYNSADEWMAAVNGFMEPLQGRVPHELKIYETVVFVLHGTGIREVEMGDGTRN